VSAATINATPVATKAGFLRAFRHYDQYRTLSSVTATTVVISGGADKLTPPSHAHDLAGGIPGAMLVHRPTAGHMLLTEAPHVISKAIIGVIGAHRTGAGVSICSPLIRCAAAVSDRRPDVRHSQMTPES
jgi:pimeloyl-ACP methyl ester carboxylesterase